MNNVRTYIKKLVKSGIEYTKAEMHDLVYRQVKMDEVLLDEEMTEISLEIQNRLDANWPFKPVIQ